MSTRARVKLSWPRAAKGGAALSLVLVAILIVPSWHFEDRHANNAIPSGLAELDSKLWEELPEELSIYHDDGVGKKERKFIRANEDSFLGLGGHEAVWNPDTEALIDEGPYRATYNYVHPGGFFSGFGHVIFDVVPYWFGGTERGGEGTSFFQRVTGKQLDDVSFATKTAMGAAVLAVTAIAGRRLYRTYQRRTDTATV